MTGNNHKKRRRRLLTRNLEHVLSNPQLEKGKSSMRWGAATGKARWIANTGAPLLNSPAIDPKTARVFIGSEAMRVHAFALADGRELWRSDKLPGASLRGYHPVINHESSAKECPSGRPRLGVRALLRRFRMG